MQHTPDWINLITEELVIQRFEDRIFEMSLHGVPEKEIKRLRTDFYRQLRNEEKNIYIPIEEFERLGLSFGKANKTKVIRGKGK